jgi:raffinose/stachyose/melibiose transport system substrate-binding protein
MLDVRRLTRVAALLALAMLPCRAMAQSPPQLVIESWRNDDLAAWNDVIIPAFKKTHPGIDVVFRPTQSSLYNSALNSKLEAGTAGDLVFCRAFDASLALFKRGALEDLTKLPGAENYPARARAAWSTDDQSQLYCLPIASVMLGFMYNQTVFKDLGLSPPATLPEFYAALDKIKASGTTPLAFGLGDPWVGSLFAFHNMGPNFYHGETGRQAVLQGKLKLSDKPFVDLFTTLARWPDYLAPGFESQKNTDSKQLFALGRAAIYPAGSWDISQIEKTADFPVGVFHAPVPAAGDECFVSENLDVGIGLNAKSANKAAARTFLSWVASPEFATVYGNALPGSFPLSSASFAPSDKLAQDFEGFKKECSPSIWLSYQFLSRGQPTLETEIFNTVGDLMRRKITPAAAADRLQTGLDRWYHPSP